MDERPWYETAFEEGYLAVYPHRDLPAARREAAGLVAAGLRGRVLDSGCGFGRHTLALLEEGLDAWGLDRSGVLLRRAFHLEGAKRLAGRLVRGDFRRLPFSRGAFDGVCMLFSSFGYFDEEGNRQVLVEVERVLRSEGILVLDLMNADRIRATLVPESRRERDGAFLFERRRLAAEGTRVVKEVHLEVPGAPPRTWHEDVRLFGPQEIAAVIRSVGLDPIRWAGDFDGRPFGPEAPRQIVWARKP